MAVNNFNDIAKNTLDEWVYFLKNSEVKDNFKAKGLDKAKEKLRYESLTAEQKKMYDRFQDNRRIQISVEYTAKLEAEQKAVEIAKNLIVLGLDNTTIAKGTTGLTIEQIEGLRQQKN